jgi:hypothetical protein
LLESNFVKTVPSDQDGKKSRLFKEFNPRVGDKEIVSIAKLSIVSGF